MRTGMLRLAAIVALIAGALVLGTAASAAGNSDAAHACQQGGYANYTRADGTTFANTGACVSYAAQGGTLKPKPIPAIMSFGKTGSCTNAPSVTITWTSTGGTSAVLDHLDADVNGGGLIQSVAVPTNGSFNAASFSPLPFCDQKFRLVVTGPGGTVSQTIVDN